MNIAMVSALFPPNVVGGAELSTCELAKALTERGEGVHIITTDFGRRDKKNVFRLHYVTYPFSLKNDVVKLRILTCNPLYLLMLTAKIVEVVKRYNIDIIHAQNNTAYIPSWLASKITGKPVIITLRDSRFNCELGFCLEHGRIETNCGFLDYLKCAGILSKKAKNRYVYFFGAGYMYLYRGVVQFVIRRVNGVTAISKFLREIAIKGGLKEVNVVYNIITPPVEEVELPKDRKIISFAGRLDPKKGVHILIEAFREVIKVVQSRLIIIGDTNNKYSEELKERVKKLDLDDDVIFMGKLRNEQVLGVFKNSDLVVVPSIWPEFLGRTVLEAQYVGTPVVASNIGGIPEIEDVFLVNPNDKDALGDGIKKVLSSGKNNKLKRGFKEDFNEARICSQTMEMYQKIVDATARKL